MNQMEDKAEHRHGHGGHQTHAAGRQRGPLAVGILTCSDRGSRGERADVAGPTIHNLVLEQLPGAKIAQYLVVPDAGETISSTLRAWADDERLDLILTTGGTGLSSTDVTPEATRAVIEREVQALTMAMLFESLRVTPYAMLTRAVAGIRGKTLIINLPGNPKAVRENLEAVIEVLPHAIQIIRGEDTHGGGHAGTGHESHDSDEHREEAKGGGQQAHGHGSAESHGHGGHDAHASGHSRASDGGIARNVGGPPC